MVNTGGPVAKGEEKDTGKVSNRGTWLWPKGKEPKWHKNKDKKVKKAENPMAKPVTKSPSSGPAGTTSPKPAKVTPIKAPKL